METHGFEYQTVGETAQAWGVGKRWVNMCIADGRVPGVVRKGNMWLVPRDAAKPGEPRRPAPEGGLSAELARVIDATILSWPQKDPDALLATVPEARFRLQFESEFAFLRGDFERVVRCFRAMGEDSAAKLRACSLMIAVAVGTGDYALYTEIEAYLKEVARQNETDELLPVFAELCLATAYTGAIAPNMLPAWLKEGDFSALPPKARPDAAYKRAKYFQSLGYFDSMLSVAETSLSFCCSAGALSFHDIYFRVACAIACVSLGREEDARRWLSQALARALPCGFIMPFAESATAFGGLLEEIVKREYPAFVKPIAQGWKHTFANWISFHNQFTRDNITSMLSMRDYEMAAMVARRVPRAQIAERFHLSTGRLNNIMKEIYGKLYVSGRDELAQYIL